MRTCWFVVAVALLGACVLPGRSGWECDNEGDCRSGYECRSMHGDRGYTNVCMAPGETVHVGGTSNWLRFLIWPLIGISAAVGIGSRIIAARNKRRDDYDQPLPRRRRRR
jgi:hypothetical protein